MIRSSLPLAFLSICLSALAAGAQEGLGSGQGLGEGQGLGGATEASASSMGRLLDDGYEIKATAPNGNRYVVFMQKETSAYACEFVNVSATRCMPIN